MREVLPSQHLEELTCLCCVHRHDVALGPDCYPGLAGCVEPVAWPGVLADALCRRTLGRGAFCSCFGPGALHACAVALRAESAGAPACSLPYMCLQGGKYFQDWPAPMGAWPLEFLLPQFCVDVGAKYQLIGLGNSGLSASDSQEFKGTDFVACAALDGQLLAE